MRSFALALTAIVLFAACRSKLQPADAESQIVTELGDKVTCTVELPWEPKAKEVCSKSIAATGATVTSIGKDKVQYACGTRTVKVFKISPTADDSSLEVHYGVTESRTDTSVREAGVCPLTVEHGYLDVNHPGTDETTGSENGVTYRMHRFFWHDGGWHYL